MDSTVGADLLNTELSKDIYVLYGPYMVKEANLVKQELLQKGMPCDFAEVLRDIQYRDHNDATRADAPLRRAEDAVLLDTTHLNFDESVAAVSQLIKERFSL